LQLSAKTLLKPFNSALSGKATGDDEMAIPEEIEDSDGLLMPEDEGEGEDKDEDKVTDHDNEEDEDNGIDELAELGEDKQTRLGDTTAVRQAVTKVRIDDGVKIVRVLTNFISRSDNSHLQSFIRQLSLFQLGIATAVSSTSKSASSPMTL
jgi:hypothetical protein